MSFEFKMPCFSLMGMVLGLLVGTPCIGQDLHAMAEEKLGKDSQIWLTETGDNSLDQWAPRELFEDRGVILEWTLQKVVLVRPKAQKETTILGDDIVRIEPSWASESAGQLHGLFCDRQFKAVLSNGKAAVGSKIPRWQQRLILAEMVESAMALGKTGDAALLFASLSKENAPGLVLATIPIPWGDDITGSDLLKLQGQAEKWIAEESEVSQLMGASWLLTGTKRSSAIQSLESLAKNAKVPLISSYAKAQLWRTVPPAEIMSDRIPRWIALRDSLPLPAQAGPSMLLAERYSQAGRPELAIADWLRIATLHADRYHLAMTAKSKAIAALKQIGRAEEATVVEKNINP